MAKQIQINFSEKELKVLKESLKSYKENLALELYDSGHEMEIQEVDHIKTSIYNLKDLMDSILAQEIYEEDEDKYWD